MQAPRHITASAARTCRRVQSGRAQWLALALLAAALAAGCATTPEEPIPALVSAEAAYRDASSTPRIDEFGRRDMREAERNLERARNLAEEGGDLDTIEHYAFLAERHVEIAEARLDRALTQEQISRADERRQKLLLASESRQSERHRAQANQAQQRAEEAEARLALTQAELEKSQKAAKALAAQLDELKVEEQDRGTVFTLSDVVFAFDSDQLKEGGARSIARIAQTLKQYPQSNILVEGYTDAMGSDQYNADLSERRAEAVKAEFVKAGIPADRIEVEGYGEQFPVASNNTPQGRQLNRRVEIVVASGDEPVQRRDERTAASG